MGKRVQITKGVLKGRKGEVVKINDKDRYGQSYVIKDDNGEIISPVDSRDTKRI